MRGILAVLALSTLAFVTPTGGAQEPSAVIVQFRVYRDALARGDLATAEAAAAAAVAVSRLKDGDNGQTPTLLFNLARVRVQQGKWLEASDPARRAFERARSGGTAVDPLMSELLWARVRLELEGVRAAGDLQELVDRAASREDLLADRYDAAEQLGVWAQQHRSHIIARRAWVSAADAARGAAIDANFARGRARAQKAVAIIMQSLARDLVVSPTMARQARERLAEAHGLIRPFAFTPLADARLSAPQALYAQILAWDAALWSKVRTDEGGRGPARLDPNPARLDGKPVCSLIKREGDLLSYPEAQAYEGQIGAVVLRLRFGERGEYQGADVAAAVGDEGFARAVSTTAATWTYQVDMSSDCKPSPIVYAPTIFYMRS